MATNRKTPGTKVFGMDLGFQADDRLLRWAGILIAEVVIAGALSIFIIFPQISSIQKATRDLAKEQKKLTDLREKIELLADFQVQFAAQEDILTNVFPQKKDVGLAVSSIRQLATNTQMELVSYTVRGEGEADGAGIPSLNLDVTINGSAEGTTAFVDAVNNSLPLKSIENLQVVRNLVATGSAGIQQFIQTRLSINSYFLPVDVTVNAATPIQPFGERQIEVLNQLANYTLPPTTIAPSISTASGTFNPNLFGQ